MSFGETTRRDYPTRSQWLAELRFRQYCSWIARKLKSKAKK
jgi:hypothetical protein